MPFVTREAKYPEDAKTMWTAWSRTFRHKPAEEPFEGPEENEKWYVAEVDGSAVSMCAVNSYQVTRGDGVLSCGGVAGVATPPEYRKKGHGTRFMQDVAKAMRADGHVVASLYAFRDPFYGKVGYATCGWRWKIVCPAERIPGRPSDLPVRQIEPCDVMSLDGVYQSFIKGFSGAVLRTKLDWDARIGKSAPMIFAIGDPIEAYAWVKITDFWANVEVGECAWSTPRGYDAILALFRSLTHNQKTVTWYEPPNSRALALHVDRDIEFQMYRQTMHRVLDVPGAIAALKPEGDGEFTIQVADDLIDENNHAWQVWFGGGRAEATPCKSADLKIDIRAFSQALMGSPSLAEVTQHGLVDVRAHEALKCAERVFTPTPVCCMDFF